MKRHPHLSKGNAAGHHFAHLFHFWGQPKFFVRRYGGAVEFANGDIADYFMHRLQMRAHVLKLVHLHRRRKTERRSFILGVSHLRLRHAAGNLVPGMVHFFVFNAASRDACFIRRPYCTVPGHAQDYEEQNGDYKPCMSHTNLHKKAFRSNTAARRLLLKL
jgi:hypothetical protein